MDNWEAKELLNKYNSGNCTEEEKALVESWYLEWQHGEFDLSYNELESIKAQGLERLVKSYKKNPGFSYGNSYVAAAAVIFAVLSISIFLYKTKSPEQKNIPLPTAQTLKKDAVPGGNKVLLTLSDGTVVPLDDIENGKITEVAGMIIHKTTDGQIVYEISPSSGSKLSNEGAISYNQISTPRGGQHKIILSDGTKVWLNAASTLKYPLQFATNGRQVELKGEGYFEVNNQKTATGKHVPFFVSTPTQTVEVLGTHFNINSYTDEAAVVTTLLEGAVKISFNSSGIKSTSDLKNETVLKPGEQATLRDNKLRVKMVNTDEAVAWKNGYFSFEDADLQTVMRQLSRWYDVDVVYKGEMSPETFTGKVQRNMSLVKVLDILSYAQINYKMEGKKLIITP